MAAVAMVFAGVSGFIAGQKVSFAGDALSVHRITGILATISSSLTMAVLWWPSSRSGGRARLFYLLALYPTLALVIVTGHYGNIIVRGDASYLWRV